MSTCVPNWYKEALRPDWAFTYCGPLSAKSRYAVASSRGVNVSRALGCTTMLIKLHRLLRTDPPSKLWSPYQLPAEAVRGPRLPRGRCQEGLRWILLSPSRSVLSTGL